MCQRSDWEGKSLQDAAEDSVTHLPLCTYLFCDAFFTNF